MNKIIVAVALCAITTFAADLTTNNDDPDTSRIARYLVTMGGTNKLGIIGSTIPFYTNYHGFVDFVSFSGNIWGWWRMNDGITNVNSGNTYGGFEKDYFGYIFKRPATVTNIVFWNWIYFDGGTFSNTPAVQILTTRNGAWQDISSSCSPAYDPSFTPANSSKKYVITPSVPQENIYGIRLIGDAEGTTDTNGFIGCAELQLNGYINISEWNNLILTANLALASEGAIAIMGPGPTQYGNPENINDGDLNTREQTWNTNVNDYVGVLWTNKTVSGISGVGIAFRKFFDGGWFATNSADLKVQYSKNFGTNWADYSSVDFGGYLEDYFKYPFAGQRFAYLFTFPDAGEINGIRVYGDPGGTGDDNGFVSVYEFEAFQDIPEPFSLFALVGIGFLALLRQK